MKIMQLNCVYPKGSTGKLTEILHKAYLDKGEDSIVLYGRGATVNAPSVYKVCSEIGAKFNHARSCLNGVMYGGAGITTRRIISIIKKEKPDVVHLQCINGYWVNIYKLITWLKKSGISTVLNLHAEFMYTANCGTAVVCNGWLTGCGNCPRLKSETQSLFFDRTNYSFKKMQKAFLGFNKNLVVAAVSPWLLDRVKQSPILGDKNALCVYNGVNTSIFKYSAKASIAELSQNKGEKIILHVTASFTDKEDDLKGGIWLIRLAEAMKDMPVRFIVAGRYNIENKLLSNITLLGDIEDQNLLSQYYSGADLTVLFSKSETFSMVVAESLCCGTPVIGFKAGGPEQITIKEYSDFYAQNDFQGIMEGAKKWLWNTNVEREEIARKAASVYSTEKMIENYMEIYRRFE